MDEDRIIGSGKYLALIDRGTWEFVSRHTGPATVAVVALTAADELVLVEQFRPPLQRRTIELPAGLIGDDIGTQGESALSAAIRELEEEAGYAAGRWVDLGTFVSSSGLTDETVTYFAALDLERIGSGGGVDNECITTHLVPLPELYNWLDEQRDKSLAIDAKLFGGVHLALRTRDRQDSRV